MSLAASLLLAGAIPALAQSQSKPKTATVATQSKKIRFDLANIDADGLRGPADGKTSVSYEFCIPDTKRCRAEVKRIDPGVGFFPGSSGHIGAKKGQCLCISSTAKKNWRAILNKLAALSYIERIIEAYFE